MKHNPTPLLVHEIRGGCLDNIHRGTVMVVDLKEETIFSQGEAAKEAFIRSSAKPLQALPVFECGALEKFNLTDAESAILCGSHIGGPLQVETVRSILSKIGRTEQDLECGGGIEDNCSGKHAGMLILAKIMQTDHQNYSLPEHPVQKLVRQTVQELCGIQGEMRSATDGCGVPIFYMPLRNMALAYARLAVPDSLPPQRVTACRKIVTCMQSHPAMTGEPDFFSVCRPVFFSKSGANGLYCAGIPEKGIGIALKIDDGASLPARAALLSILSRLEIIQPEEYQQLVQNFVPPVMNRRGAVVGKIIVP